jgi:hypothetical protein
MIDPLFLHELALELGMSVGDIQNRMSAHELTVEWPAYFAARERIRKTQEAQGGGVV